MFLSGEVDRGMPEALDLGKDELGTGEPFNHVLCLSPKAPKFKTWVARRPDGFGLKAQRLKTKPRHVGLCWFQDLQFVTCKMDSLFMTLCGPVCDRKSDLKFGHESPVSFEKGGLSVSSWPRPCVGRLHRWDHHE